MRVKPAPGHYLVTVAGTEEAVEITQDGALSHVIHLGVPHAFDWQWFEMSGGPGLMPENGFPVSFIGFYGDGTFHVVFPDDREKGGTYAPTP